LWLGTVSKEVVKLWKVVCKELLDAGVALWDVFERVARHVCELGGPRRIDAAEGARDGDPSSSGEWRLKLEERIICGLGGERWGWIQPRGMQRDEEESKVLNKSLR
jgi:hypothetical protein